MPPGGQTTEVIEDAKPQYSRDGFDRASARHVQNVFETALNQQEDEIEDTIDGEQANILLAEGVIDDAPLQFEREGGKPDHHAGQQAEHDLLVAADVPDVAVDGARHGGGRQPGHGRAIGLTLTNSLGQPIAEPFGSQGPRDELARTGLKRESVANLLSQAILPIRLKRPGRTLLCGPAEPA